MSCRFSLEHKDKPYPRTCPTCGVSGKCQQGFRQIAVKEWARVDGKPKYVILDGNGRPPIGFADKYYTDGIPASILIAQGKDLDQVAHVEAAPVQPPKPPVYGPDGCNVALRKNGIVPPATCELCSNNNGGPFGVSESHARGCLHWHHATGFGFVEGQALKLDRPWPGNPDKVAPKSEIETGPIWHGERPKPVENEPRKHVAHFHATPPKLSRVKRAMALDLMDDITDHIHSDANLNKWLDQILEIICKN